MNSIKPNYPKPKTSQLRLTHRRQTSKLRQTTPKDYSNKTPQSISPKQDAKPNPPNPLIPRKNERIERTEDASIIKG
ncbi:hypothetical protein COLO4_23630 [Corchorus olitorius]|uniref:Uncharacterized protein n=1 Tax=Corchorus olitorius TaxID=93759 RepID=A0A1R3IFP5_9ROSI|nr:hypothetical protein COLO4_23630 [Corchorus olitorius]